jgi:hypothetical protein
MGVQVNMMERARGPRSFIYATLIELRNDFYLYNLIQEVWSCQSPVFQFRSWHNCN